MTRAVIQILSVVTIAALSACGGTGGSRADLVFRQVDCAKQVGIGGAFSTQYVLKDGKQTEVFVPTDGVSEAQAAQANACMAS